MVMECNVMNYRLNNRPSFDNNEPEIQIILRYKDNKRQKFIQGKISEITVYNNQELHDLENGIFQTVNNIRNART